MAVSITVSREDIITIDLAKDRLVRRGVKFLSLDDKNADIIGAYLKKDGQDFTIPDGTVCKGTFITSAGGTIEIDGNISGNLVSVTLPQSCYAYEGSFSLAVRLYGNSIVGTVRIVDGVVTKTTTDTIIDPGSVVPNVQELLQYITDVGTATTAANTAATNATNAASYIDTNLDALDNTINAEHSLIKYGYKTYEELAEESTSSSNSKRVGIKQNLTKNILNCSNPPTSVDIKIKISNGIARGSVNSDLDSWTTGTPTVNGHIYKIIMRHISGTVTQADATKTPAIAIYKKGTHASISTITRSGNDSVSEFTSDGSEINLVLWVYRNTTLINAVYQIVMEDVTAKTADLLAEITNIIQYPENTSWT